MSATSPDRPDPVRLTEYAPGSAVVLTEAERRPTLSPTGRVRLDTLLTDPDAPTWTHTAGDRLSAESVTRSAVPQPTGGWLVEHLATVRALPAYRGHPGPLVELADFPLVDRSHLMADIGGFVPVGADLDQLVHGTSSGSTGHALQIPDHLEDVARTLTLVRDLVAAQGVAWRPESDRMALAYVVRQRQAFTYASTLSAFDEATMARLNLEPTGWPDRDAFLARHDPQVYTGDPTALAELLDPGLLDQLHPLALVSGAAELSAALRADLVAAYGCPVLDLYGLHETRPIAVSADGGPHVVLDRRVLVEILDPAGVPVREGERGEIVVTAGENPLLPLARYRTGDFGRLVQAESRPAIADLEGRASVVFMAADGSPVPSVDLTQLLQAAGAHGWRVEQHPDGRVTAAVVRGDGDQIAAALSALLGSAVIVTTLERLSDLGEGKPQRFIRWVSAEKRPPDGHRPPRPSADRPGEERLAVDFQRGMNARGDRHQRH